MVFFAFENLRLCFTQATADRDAPILYPHRILYLSSLCVVHKIFFLKEEVEKREKKRKSLYSISATVATGRSGPVR